MRNRGKDILLLVVALVALVVGVYTFRGKPKRAPASAPTAAPSERAPGPEAASAAKKEAAAEEQAKEEPTAAARNPFSAPGASAAAGSQVSAAPEEKPAEPAAEEEKQPSPALRLTGIVAGRPALAIIRDNGERYFVRVGDQVGDRYRVRAIGRQEVVLVGPQGEVILAMGGRQ